MAITVPTSKKCHNLLFLIEKICFPWKNPAFHFYNYSYRSSISRCMGTLISRIYRALQSNYNLFHSYNFCYKWPITNTAIALLILEKSR
mgnify:FL=1